MLYVRSADKGKEEEISVIKPRLLSRANPRNTSSSMRNDEIRLRNRPDTHWCRMFVLKAYQREPMRKQTRNERFSSRYQGESLCLYTTGTISRSPRFITLPQRLHAKLTTIVFFFDIERDRKFSRNKIKFFISNNLHALSRWREYVKSDETSMR